MEKISYKHTRLKQGKTPICGIYAFLNGIYAEADFSNDSKKTLKKLAEKLWVAAFIKKIPSRCCLNAKSPNLHYSVIGEFFSSTKLEEFLTEKAITIVKKIVKKSLLDIKDVEVSKIECIDQLKKEKNVFYIIPINSSQNGNNNMHWICLKYIKNRWYILNSGGDRSSERRALTNTNIKRKIGKFMGGINNFEELEKVWNNMRDRCSCKTFDFNEWSDGKKFKKWKKQFKKWSNEEEEKLKDRLNYIQNYETIFCFKESEFNILKVKLIK